MDPVAIGTLIIRFGNLLLWVVVCGQILQHDQPVPRMVRQLIVSIIIFGMLVLAIGSLVPYVLPAEIARPLYTAFTAYAAIIAIGILSTHILDDKT